MSGTIADLITDSFDEIAVFQAGQAVPAQDAAYALRKLNRILDNLNAVRSAVYNEEFTTYTMVPNLQPHTIGPTGATFTVTQRPETIDGANVILNNVTPIGRVPMSIRDDQWWLAQSVPTITSQFPTDVYYSPGWPNGSLYLWPVPTLAYDLELMARLVLASVTLTTVVSLPPGYQDMLTLTLAESLSSGPSYSVPLELYQRVVKNAREARARVWANNDPIPHLATRDSGIPSNAGTRSNFNWRTGLTTP